MGGEAKAALTAMEAALNIPLLTWRILTQVDFNDKKNIRLVSRLWRDCTLEHWRNTAAIRIAIPYQMSTYGYATSGMVSIKGFEEMMKEERRGSEWAPFRIQELPFTRFILHGGTFYLPKRGEGIKATCAYSPVDYYMERFKRIENNLSKVFQFLNKYGPTMKYLWLEKTEFAPGLFVPGVEWIVKKGCPQLEALSLHAGHIYKPFGEQLTHSKDTLIFETSSGKMSPNDGGRKLIKFEGSNFENGYPGQSVQVDHIWIQILRTMPNLKVLKYHSSRFDGCYFPVVNALSVPCANGKFLQLEELDSDCPAHRIHNLASYIDECLQVPLKKLRVNLDFCNGPYGIFRTFEERYPHLNQFFASHGNSLTTLAIKLPMTCGCCGTDRAQRVPAWIPHLTGYNFTNLTHLFVSHGFSDRSHDFGCGTFKFDFKVFKAMPKLQVFRCSATAFNPSVVITPESLEAPWRREDRALPEAYHEPTELKNLKEFSYSANYFNLDSLRIVLHWMKGVKKVSLDLDDKTFPLVCEMLPNLEELILIQNKWPITPVEKETGEIWLDEKASEWRGKEWRRRDEKKRFGEEFANKLQMERKKKARAERMEKKEKLERKKWKEEVDTKRKEVEKMEKEWIGKQEGEGWNFVSYRKEKKEKKVPIKILRVKKVTVNYVVSKDTILAELRKTPRFKIYNTNRIRVSCIAVQYDFQNFEWCQLIQYKIGRKSEF